MRRPIRWPSSASAQGVFVRPRRKAEVRSHGRVREPDCRFQLRARLDKALGDHRQHDVPLGAGLRRDEFRHAETCHGHSHGLDVPAGDGGLHGEGLRGVTQAHPLEAEPKRLDGVLWQVREIGECALDSFGAFAPRVAQKVGRAGAAIWDCFDIHGRDSSVSVE